MTPYYQDDSVTIYHGDCRDVLPTLPDADLLFTDPPYVGLTGGYRRAFPGVAAPVGDSLAIGDEWNADLSWVPLVRATGGLVFCSHHSVVQIPDAFVGWRRVALLTWWKRNAPPTGKNLPRFRSEFIWALAKRPGIGWDGLTDTVYDVPGIPAGCFDTGERTGHPTQKPLRLMTKILAVVRADLVLDPFAGSGTTLVAAKECGHRAIGIEIEERYCEIAAERCRQEVLAL